MVFRIKDQLKLCIRAIDQFAGGSIFGNDLLDGIGVVG
jgi:hypothetical protein